jgi:hypothetical protein
VLPGANTGITSSSQDPPDADATAELERIRGWSKCDQAVHSVMSWTTRKCYPTQVGISLGNADMVGGEMHEIQLWEERQDLPIIMSGAKWMSQWLIDELEKRSANGLLPTGMPPTFTGIEVKTKKTGKL